MMKKKILGAVLAGGMLFGTANAAFAGVETKGKCNSGRGNSSESTPETDCDPGNSGGKNNGGD